MNSNTLILTFLFLSFLMVSPKIMAQHATQENESKDELILEKPFDAISVDDGWSVSLYLGKSPRISTNRVDESLLPLLEYKIRDGVLFISSTDDKPVRYSNKNNLAIYYNGLEIFDMEVSNGSSITSPHEFKQNEIFLSAYRDSSIKLYLDTQKCVAEASANSEVILRGKCREFESEAVMHSFVDANTLRTENAYLNSSSSSSITIGETKNLVEHRGAEGEMHFRGKPRRQKEDYKRYERNRFERNRGHHRTKQGRRGWYKKSEKEKDKRHRSKHKNKRHRSDR